MKLLYYITLLLKSSIAVALSQIDPNNITDVPKKLKYRNRNVKHTLGQIKSSQTLSGNKPNKTWVKLPQEQYRFH